MPKKFYRPDTVFLVTQSRYGLCLTNKQTVVYGMKSQKGKLQELHTYLKVDRNKDTSDA